MQEPVDAEELRELARQARQEAEAIDHPDWKEAMLEIARIYERLAESLDREATHGDGSRSTS
jgi:hypothetical protein